MNNYLPYKNNIKVKPVSKNKVIGDTSKYELYGEVVAVGVDVATIRVGDNVTFTLWGVNESITPEHYIIQDNPDFIKEVQSNG